MLFIPCNISPLAFPWQGAMELPRYMLALPVGCDLHPIIISLQSFEPREDGYMLPINFFFSIIITLIIIVIILFILHMKCEYAH